MTTLLRPTENISIKVRFAIITDSITLTLDISGDFDQAFGAANQLIESGFTIDANNTVTGYIEILWDAGETGTIRLTIHGYNTLV